MFIKELQGFKLKYIIEINKLIEFVLHVFKSHLVKIFFYLVHFNVGTVSGIVHIQTLFFLLPCLGQHVWGGGNRSTKFPLPEMVHIFNILSINQVFNMSPAEKVQGMDVDSLD